MQPRQWLFSQSLPFRTLPSENSIRTVRPCSAAKNLIARLRYREISPPHCGDAQWDNTESRPSQFAFRAPGTTEVILSARFTPSEKTMGKETKEILHDPD